LDLISKTIQDIIEITSYWIDDDVAYASLKLKRVELLGNTINMATMNTSWQSSAYNSKTTSAVAWATIENDNYYYFLQLEMPATNQIQFLGLKIEYTTNAIK
jgi:hypothetical protein